MITYSIKIPGLAYPVTGYFNGTKEETEKHKQKVIESFEKRMNQRHEDAQKAKIALSGPNVLRGL
jgi:hypothetical protein